MPVVEHLPRMHQALGSVPSTRTPIKPNRQPHTPLFSEHVLTGREDDPETCPHWTNQPDCKTGASEFFTHYFLLQIQDLDSTRVLKTKYFSALP